MHIKYLVRRFSFILVTAIASVFIPVFLFFTFSAQAFGENPFSEAALFVDPTTAAYQAYETTKVVNPAEAEEILKITSTAQAKWFGNWNVDIQGDVDQFVTQVTSSGALPVLVAYNIPVRDCNSYSAGGAVSADAYRRWIDGFVNGVGQRQAVIFFEPDGLGLLDCLSEDQQDERITLYQYATDAFAQNTNATVYLDASQWVPVDEMADLLIRAGVEKTRGVVTNVSGFETTETSTNYVKALKAATGLPIFGIIDTSRNGLGPDPQGEWCNPSGRALGQPSGLAQDPDIDAYYWIKPPGESDGTCNGGPSAGNWWQEYAVGLASKSPYFDDLNVVEPVEQPDLTTSDSTLTVYAAGIPANGEYPALDILIEGQHVASFIGITGDPNSNQYVSFSYSQPEPILPSDVRLEYRNDAATATEDRNLKVDRIVIDGVEYQTEDAATYSVGSWDATAGCDGGYKQSEWLHCAGYLQFSSSTSSDSDQTNETVETTNPFEQDQLIDKEVIPTEAYQAEYFNNTDLAGSPLLVREDNEIYFNWGDTSPDSVINPDNFSARWTRSVDLDEGSYTVTVTADDGVRVKIDGTVVIDQWQDQSPTTTSVVVPLSAGSHRVQVEYYERGGGAVMQFKMEKQMVTHDSGFSAQYYNNRQLQGEPVLVRSDQEVNFDWQGGSPDPSINSDKFSARWSKEVELSAGSYQFLMRGDDGYRVYVDGEVILDQWRDQSAATATNTVSLSEGLHTITVEYYEHGGDAVAQFSYSKQ